MTEQTPIQQQSPQDSAPKAAKTSSGLAMAGMVLGIVAIATSFIPIVNNASFVVAIVGVILSFIGLRQIKKNAVGGSGKAITGIVLSILALVITLLVQSACSAALDSVTENETGTVSSSSTKGAESGEPSKAPGKEEATNTDTKNMSIGQTVDLKNGMSITVNSASHGLINYDGSSIVCVNVTYVNNSESTQDFNDYDWKSEDASGVQRDTAFFSEATDELSFGSLAPGGSVTGNIYFEDSATKVVYFSNIFSSESDIAWNI